MHGSRSRFGFLYLYPYPQVYGYWQQSGGWSYDIVDQYRFLTCYHHHVSMGTLSHCWAHRLAPQSPPWSSIRRVYDMHLEVVWCIPATQGLWSVWSRRIAHASVLRVFGIHCMFLLSLNDLGAWGRALSVPGWAGSTVNQHCQLRLEALPQELGENELGGASDLKLLGSLWAARARCLRFSGHCCTWGYCPFMGGAVAAPPHHRLGGTLSTVPTVACYHLLALKRRLGFWLLLSQVLEWGFHALPSMWSQEVVSLGGPGTVHGPTSTSFLSCWVLWLLPSLTQH